jgi:hypothetical protein
VRRLTLLTALASVVVPLALVPLSTSPAAAAGCDPGLALPQLQGSVPTPRQVLGLDLGDRDVTLEESDRYLQAVDEASDRVVTGTLATSAEGRPLRYAVVGTPERLRRLDAIGADVQRLRDPALPAAEAEAIVRRSPDVLWVAGNVHGDEESGTDAALGTLQRVADSVDCAAVRIRDNAVVVILPSQNPDGRVADTRRNSYGFDINRDWFARTQPETDGKIEMMRRLPPQLFVDDHEMGRDGFFFPPNADPVYHEVPRTSVRWINQRYGSALAKAFEQRDIPYFNEDVYDLFYMGYGDTVPSTGFTAAGMTFEISNTYSARTRFQQQSLAQWVSVFQGANGREQILRDYHRSHVDAAAQGAAGRLQDNRVYNPGNEVQTQVPDREVRSYFIRTDDPVKAREVARLVERLQGMDVEVRSLTAPTTVPDYKPYGEPVRRAVTMPPGTLWVSMAQGQKHWVQAMLNEDTYVPFPYFYDVTAWSSPLLLDLDGGSTGADLAPASRVLPPAEVPAAPAPTSPQRVRVLAPVDDSSTTDQSVGWLRWRLEQDWGLPYELVTAQQVAAGALGSADVLVVADQDEEAVRAALGAAGRTALRTWVREGGHFVGWRGGTRLAVALGLSSATLTAATSDVPGSLFEVDLDQASAVTRGLGREAWAYYSYDDVMRSDHAVMTFPQDGFVSGFAEGEEELRGTAAAADEPRGQGRVTVFSVEPNFRGFTDGTARMVWNALTGARPRPAAGTELAPERQLALGTERTPIRVTVPVAAEAATAAVLASHGASVRVERAGDRVRFVVAGGSPVDQHPWAGLLEGELDAAGVTPVAVTFPTG